MEENTNFFALCVYIIWFELILSKILNGRQSRIFLTFATLRLRFLRHDELQIWGWGLPQRWWSEPIIKQFPIWGQGFGCLDLGTSSF